MFLLSIALVPMLLVGLVHPKAMNRLGGRLASDTRKTLRENAECRLRTAVFNYSQPVDRDMRTTTTRREAS